MVGLVRTEWGEHWTLARRNQRKLPPIERYGLKIMSAGFVVGEDQPLADAGLIRLLAQQFMWLVDWGPLDFLLVDLPPGTAEAQQVFVRAVPLSGAVLVVTPQDVAHLDAKKAVQMYRRAGVTILGGVENMSMSPYVMRGTRWGTKMGHVQMSDMMMEALYDTFTGTPMAITAENLAAQYNISREEADAFALHPSGRLCARRGAGRRQRHAPPTPRRDCHAFGRSGLVAHDRCDQETAVRHGGFAGCRGRKDLSYCI
jgi:hypothetical protein